MDGAEILAAQGDLFLNIAWNVSGVTFPTRDTSVFRSGVASYKCDSAAGNTTSFVDSTVTIAVTTSYYFRAYLKTTAVPSSQIAIMGGAGLGTSASVAYNTNGTLTLWIGSAQGSASAAINDGTWHRIEFLVTTGAVASTVVAAELRVDGATAATFSGSVASLSIDFRAGWVTAPGANKIINVDDLALNDSTGADQNSWPGAGTIVLLKAISDNARGVNWVGGAGGTSNLWDAVDNTPPVGVATGSGTNTSQIHNIVKDTTGNYDANLSTYTTAGIIATDTINVVYPVWNGSGVATGNAIQLVSNPTITAGTANFSGLTPGTYPTSWAWASQVAYSPSVTLGTSPVIRIGKRANSTNEVAVDYMGAMVEYVPAAAAKPRRLPTVTNHVVVMQAATR
jgi:hypothetical protein